MSIQSVSIRGRFTKRGGGWSWRVGTSLPDGEYEVLGMVDFTGGSVPHDEITSLTQGIPEAKILAVRPGLLGIVKEKR